MKKSIYKFTILIIITLVFVRFQGTAQGRYSEKTKEIKKSYNLSRKTKLAVSSKYGDIHINTWDKNQMDVKITITAEKFSERRAQELIDNVDIDIRGDGNSGLIEFTTRISGNINNRRNERFSIDYEIHMPKISPININHKYGNLYLSDLDATADIDVAYGKVRIDKINGDANLELSYGGGEIEKIGSGELDISYANLNIENCADMALNSKYSNLNFGTAGRLDISNKYGNLEIDKVSSIVGGSKYGGIKIDDLTKVLDLEIKYGGGLRVRNISKNFERIVVDAEYATSELAFESGSSAKIEAQTRYGKVRYDSGDFDFNYVNTSNNASEYRGKIGKVANPESVVKLYASYGSIILDIE